MKDTTFLWRVRLKNYKSIAACDVSLGPLTFLVGPNGSGKSNFLDALRFVADALRHSLEHALRERGGINDVRRRSSGHPTHFSLDLSFNLPDGGSGGYYFQIAARPQGGFEVQEEECTVVQGETLSRESFKTRSGKVVESSTPLPAAAKDRLFLVSASNVQPFRGVYDSLSRMGFYNLNPDRIRDLQAPDSGELLRRDGSNLASVLRELTRHDPEGKGRIEEYLRRVVPGVLGVDAKILGPKETVEFKQEVAGSSAPWRFLASNMSDGTLRALGVLVALFQRGNGDTPRIPLVGIEEPEVALHPAAAGVLLDCLREACRRTQVLVTSHSPDLLDHKELAAENILAVYSERGSSLIAPLNDAGKAALRERLYTAGELLRLDVLRPDPGKAISRPALKARR